MEKRQVRMLGADVATEIDLLRLSPASQYDIDSSFKQSAEEGSATNVLKGRRHSSETSTVLPSKVEALLETRERKLNGDRKHVTTQLGNVGDEFSSASMKKMAFPVGGHCHGLAQKSLPCKKARNKLLLASCLCLLFMILETTGGLIAGSLAIISDAAHLLTDFVSFMISLMALFLAQRPATKRFSFGWYRIEILGALVSILMLWVLTGVLVYSAIGRIHHGDYEIDALVMLITAGTGVVFNVVLGTTLHQHAHSHGGGGEGQFQGQGHGYFHSNQDKDLEQHYENHGKPKGIHDTSNYQAVVTTNSDLPTSKPRPSESKSYFFPTTNGGSSSSSGYGALKDVAQGGVPMTNSDVENPKEQAKSDKTQVRLSNPDSNPLEMGYTQDGRRHTSNINVKAAFIHVVGDLIQSVGVLVAALIIFIKPEWKIADPICTFLFSVFVLITTITMMRDIVVVLMEGTPRGINFAEVREALLQVDGVLDIHNLRMWSLTLDKMALAVHIAVDKTSDPQVVLREASSMIQQQFSMSETTMQIEEYATEMEDCNDCKGPQL